MTDNLITTNFTKGRKEQIILIVPHTYNGAGRSLKNWFQTNNLGVSAHAAIFKDGQAERYVRWEDIAHHAGNWWVNERSIGFEHQDDGNPNDKARTDALYEKSAQTVKDIALWLGWKGVNEHNVQPHKNFTSTGCPGGLDVNRIIKRANELIHDALAPKIPEWKKNAKDVGKLKFKTQKEVSLYDISDNKVIKTYSENTDVEARYLYKDFYITEYSYNNEIDSGFKKQDLEYVKPDEITYEVYVDNVMKSSGTRDFVENFYEAVVIDEGSTKKLIENNITKKIQKVLREHTEPVKPIPEPIEEPKPDKPTPTLKEKLVELIKKFIEFIKKF